MTALKLLDAFSGAGGAARGYQLAGFDVTGVDIRPQPRYGGDQFILGDALEYIACHGHEYDAIHASPPCQGYSSLTMALRRAGRAYPDLLQQTREALAATGKPYVIENVPGAPLVNPVWLCGTEFGRVHNGRWLRRHRGFESNVPLTGASRCSCTGRRIGGVYGGGHSPRSRGFVFDAQGRRGVMGIDWMTRDELAQAIPPTYTQYIGWQLIAALDGASWPR